MIANKSIALCALGLALALAAPRARADGTTADQTLAQSLFDEAVRLMDQGRFADACPKLAESQRLDPGGGTLLNLGFCREKEGKLASAWAAYNEALSRAIKDGRKDRENTARVHVQELDGKFAKLSIDVSDAARQTVGIEIRVDDAPVRQAAWGMMVPIDRGVHGIVVTAPGKRDYHTSVNVEADGDVRHVAIPALVAAAVRRGRDDATYDDRRHGIGGQALVGWVVGGVGVALLGVGVATGFLALDAHDQSNASCPAGHCTADGVTFEERAKTYAWLSDFGVGLGAAAIVTGLVLLITAPRAALREHPRAASVHVVPLVSAYGAGASFAMSF